MIPDLGVAAPRTPGLTPYANIPPAVGAVVSLRMATLLELQTVYGVLDLYDLLEIASIDAHNQRLIREASAKRANHRN